MPITKNQHGAPDEAVIHQWEWKSAAMRAMTVEVCRLSLARGMHGEFSALDLPTHGEDAHGGSGIAGSVFGRLAKAGIIAAVGILAGNVFYPKRVPNACGNPIGVWRLDSRALAEAMVRVHGAAVGEPEQLEMAV